MDDPDEVLSELARFYEFAAEAEPAAKREAA
jgi:hypothetical protein